MKVDGKTVERKPGWPRLSFILLLSSKLSMNMKTPLFAIFINNGINNIFILFLLFSNIITVHLLLALPLCCDCFFAATASPRRSSSAASALSSVITDNVHIPILYENDHLLAISKPPNIPHHDDPHSDGAGGQLGIMSLIRLQQQQQQASPSTTLFSYPHRLYGVHRLDRVTSGILLLAKNTNTANILVNKFKNKQITKYYLALSGKKPRKKKQGWVQGNMVLGRRGSYKLVNENNKDKETASSSDHLNEKTSSNYAVTRFFTAGLGNISLSPSLLRDVAKNSSRDEEEISLITPKTAILFQPHTGRTHQLRVAAKAVGLPILGDARYGGGHVCCTTKTGETKTTTTTTNNYSDFDRTYLHAAAIHFEINNEQVCIYSPPPFGHLFSCSSELDEVFLGMIKKSCDCMPILQHLRQREERIINKVE